MKIKKLILPNTFIIEPKVFYDKRGFLYEIWRKDLYFNNKIKLKNNQKKTITLVLLNIINGLTKHQ